MREKTLTMSSVLVLSVLMISIPGCAANRVNLVDTNQVAVTNQGSEKIRILWTDIYQKDGQTWAYGVLKQSSSVGGTLKAHVDVQIVSPDGSLQYETISKELYVPRKRIGRMDWKRFRVQLPAEISEGSNISVTVHTGKHSENSVFMEGTS